MLPVTSDCCSTVAVIKGSRLSTRDAMQTAVWRLDIRNVKKSGRVTAVRDGVPGNDDGGLSR